MNATSETTVVELNIRLQKNSHGFQKLLFNGRILADFEALGSLCTNSAGATMSKLSLQSEHQEPLAFAFKCFRKCFRSSGGDITTTWNITVDQITSEILDRFASPDPTIFYLEESHAWLLRILGGDEYRAVLDSNPEHAEHLMALVSSPPAEVKVLRYSQGRICTGRCETTKEVLIAGHRLKLLVLEEGEEDSTYLSTHHPLPPIPRTNPPRPAPNANKLPTTTIPNARTSYPHLVKDSTYESTMTYRDTRLPPAEEMKAVGEKWLASQSARVLTIDIQRHDDIIHVSCLTLSGEREMSSDFPANATLADLEAEVTSTLNWRQLEFVSANGKVKVSEPLKAYSTLSAKEVPFSDFSLGGIDKKKCRRCGSEQITVSRTVDWCQMNGDAGGKLISFCKVCGLQLETSWSED